MKEKEYMRLESDSIGTMEVPEDAYYGVQALRAKENFPITAKLLADPDDWQHATKSSVACLTKNSLSTAYRAVPEPVPT